MELPGIVSADPVFSTLDGPEIYVCLSELYGYTYLFRYAYDDCQRRCRKEEYFYFRFYENDPVLVGRWNPAETGPPAWWAEIENEWIACSCFPQILHYSSDTPRDRRVKQK